MRDPTDAKEDSAADVTSVTPWRVVQARALDGYRLAVRFADGTSGEVDVSKLIFGPTPGVFEPLRNAQRFAEVGIDHGAVTWPGELDLAPDAMYDGIKATGSWTP